MQQRLFGMSAVQGAGSAQDPPDAGLIEAKGPVEQVKKRFTAEKPDSRRVRPDDAGARGVPKPSRLGNVPQVIQRGGRHVSQLFTLPFAPPLRWLNQKTK